MELSTTVSFRIGGLTCFNTRRQDQTTSPNGWIRTLAGRSKTPDLARADRISPLTRTREHGNGVAPVDRGPVSRDRRRRTTNLGCKCRNTGVLVGNYAPPILAGTPPSRKRSRENARQLPPRAPFWGGVGDCSALVGRWAPLESCVFVKTAHAVQRWVESSCQEVTDTAFGFSLALFEIAILKSFDY